MRNLLPKSKRLFSFLILLILVVIFLLKQPLVPVVKAQTPRPLKYYGADIVNPGDLATLSQYNINTAVVVMNAYGSQSSWQAFFPADSNINIVVWPLGGSGACGFPYNGTDITPVHNLLNYLGTQDRFLGIINAHEPSWSCPMSISEMTEIRRRLKDYVRNNFGREIQVWNYIDNITSFVTSGEIMDVAVTWQHCIGGAEGDCPSAKAKIIQDRAAIDNNGWSHVDLVYAFQTFEIADTGYRMPTADEMYDWGCQMLQTNALDGFFWYTWQNPAGYTQVLAGRSDLWPTMSRVYNDCVNTDGIPPTPTITPGGPILTPTPSQEHCPRKPQGDANCDGSIDGIDYSMWLNSQCRKTATQSCASTRADFNGDENIDDEDYNIWFKNRETGTTPTPTSTPPPNATSTPTPTLPPRATPTPTPIPGSPPASGSFIYGARYASANSYWDLAGLGIMHPNSIVYSNGFESQIETIISTAHQVQGTYPNFKPSLFMWDQSTGDWSFTCSGISSAGNAFIQYLNEKNYWDDIYAINGLHEPLGRYCCSSVAQIQGVVAQIKSLSNGQAMIFEKIFSDVSEYECGLSFTDGICDYCAVLYHPYPYQGSFQSTTLSNNVKRHIDMVKDVPSGTTLNKFTPWLAAIYFPNYLYMPSPIELYDAGNIILSAVSPRGRQVDGLIWYTWDNVNQWTGLNQYNVDDQRARRMEVIEQVGGLR